MGNKMDFGFSGLAMVQKSLKESLLMVSEIVFGPLGLIMVIKSFKLLIKAGNLMVDGYHGMKVELLKKNQGFIQTTS